ncbi:MAG TPA: phospholipid carrier-dependent glycosyltransferase [Streptosporangiaceae bacterium]
MMTSRALLAADEPGSRVAALRARLVPPMPGSVFWGWAGPLLVTAFGAFLRFNRLSVPRAVIFDETYYVPDALGILRFGVEHNYVSKRNGLIAQGNPHIFASGGEFIAHPPAGKLLIAVGEWLFGLTPFGWRFASAVVGSLSILLLARVARRMTRSTLLGCAAGLLLALDGLEFVMSRTALLDIFVMFWVLAAFGCLVVDRDRYRRRLVESAPGLDHSDSAPLMGIRWWRVAAGVCLGLAFASKWNGIWYVPAFGLMCLAWDAGARRAAGFRGADRALARDIGGLAGSFVVLPLLVYIASWSGWFATNSGYDRNWAAQHGMHIPVLSDLVSLFEYHKAILAFNTGLRASHPYESKPWTWLLISRPVAYSWVCPTSGHGQCSSGQAQEVLAMGTPVIWWASVITLLVCLGWWVSRRDWRAGAVLVGVAAGWLPWFLFADRTQFYFYAVAFLPFMVLSLTLCLGLLLGPARSTVGRRTMGAAVAGAYLLGVLVNFAYLYPILAAKVIPYSDWLARMWYQGWI